MEGHCFSLFRGNIINIILGKHSLGHGLVKLYIQYMQLGLLSLQYYFLKKCLFSAYIRKNRLYKAFLLRMYDFSPYKSTKSVLYKQACTACICRFAWLWIGTKKAPRKGADCRQNIHFKKQDSLRSHYLFARTINPWLHLMKLLFEIICCILSSLSYRVNRYILRVVLPHLTLSISADF